jgi:hypothetical protein
VRLELGACRAARHAPEDIARLCEAIGVDPAEEVEMLVFMWLARCEAPVAISESEFIRGIESIGCVARACEAPVRLP